MQPPSKPRPGSQDKRRSEVSQVWSADEANRKIFCLVEAPTSAAAATAHREAHGLVSDEIYEVQEGS